MTEAEARDLGRIVRDIPYPSYTHYEAMMTRLASTYPHHNWRELTRRHCRHCRRELAYPLDVLCMGCQPGHRRRSSTWKQLVDAGWDLIWK